MGLGRTPGLGKAPGMTYQRVTWVSCWLSPSQILRSRSWGSAHSAFRELLRGGDNRKYLVLGANKWQETPLCATPPTPTPAKLSFYELHLQKSYREISQSC